LANAPTPFIPMTKTYAEEFVALYAGDRAEHLSTPRTDAELSTLRKEAVRTGYHKNYPGAPSEPGFFTCDDCSLVRACGWAFDPYNTLGDCLFDK